MINFNNHDITAITYDDHSIQKVYGCDGHLVWESQNPPVFGGKWLATYNSGYSESAKCNSTSAITIYEVPDRNRSIISVEIGDCVTNIDTGAFEDYTGLTSVKMSNNVTNIGGWAFQDCGFTSINLSNNVITIGQHAFNYCRNLTGITIPNSVTNIDAGAFFQCFKLTGITIPDSVTNIGNGAFLYCSGLTDATIGSGVTEIGESAFASCSGLTGITCLAVTPPTLGYSNVFFNTNNCPIYVPCQSVNAYKTADKWSNYADRIQPIP